MQDHSTCGYGFGHLGYSAIWDRKPGDISLWDRGPATYEIDRVACVGEDLVCRPAQPTSTNNHECFGHGNKTIALTPNVGAHTRAPMAGSMRMERVARQVQMSLAEVLIEGLKDPRYRPVTVTHVRVSPDLRHADVRFMPLGQQGDPEELATVLNAAAGYLQREVGRRIRMKFTPRFRFHVDTQGEEALYMQSLLSDIRSQLDEE